MSAAITESEFLDALREIPTEHWPAVLGLLQSLKLRPVDDESMPIRLGTDLKNSELIGIWSDRLDIPNTQEFARQLRELGSKRTNEKSAAS